MFYRIFQIVTAISLLATTKYLYSKPVFAAYPLINELDIANHNLQFWWKEGHFLTGSKLENSCILPFESDFFPPSPQMLPEDLDTWKELGQNCEALPMKLTFKENGVEYILEVQQGSFSLEHPAELSPSESIKPSLPRVLLYREGLLTAENLIPRPIIPCSLDLLPINGQPGKEILITWRLGETLRGITIFSIPESAK